MLYITVILIFFTILVFLFWLLETLFVKERFINRLEDLDPTTRVVEDKRMTVKKYNTVFHGIAKWIPKKKNNRMAEKLVCANLLITAEELFIYRLLFAIALGFLVFVYRNDVLLSLGAGLFVWSIPKTFINKRIKNRQDDFNDQLNGGLILISNALKAGHSFMQAVGIAAKETQGAFSDEFKILLKEMNFGIPIDVAFENLLIRLDSSDMRLVVNAILIQKDIGGNLSEILENISSTIRERQKIQNEMKTLTAQGKMSGMIVMLIPFFLAGVIYVFNRDYIMLLFTTNMGYFILLLAFTSEFIGVMLIRKIIKIEV